LFRDVYGGSGRCIENGGLHVFRDGYENVDIVGDAFLFVVAFNFDDETYPVVVGGLHDHVDQEERFHSNVETVAHEFEFSVGRDEGD
jgi:hypothetical protein